jgi:hypothetical protein
LFRLRTGRVLGGRVGRVRGRRVTRGNFDGRGRRPSPGTGVCQSIPFVVVAFVVVVVVVVVVELEDST